MTIRVKKSYMNSCERVNEIFTKFLTIESKRYL
jgi:hypothetical protein